VPDSEWTARRPSAFQLALIGRSLGCAPCCEASLPISLHQVCVLLASFRRSLCRCHGGRALRRGDQEADRLRFSFSGAIDIGAGCFKVAKPRLCIVASRDHAKSAALTVKLTAWASISQPGFWT
jgi:hypothetical protein